MTNQRNHFFSLQVTSYTLAIITCTIYATIILAKLKMLSILLAIYASTTLLASQTKEKKYLRDISLSLFFSLCTLISINNQNALHDHDQLLLKKPVTIQGYILDKKTTGIGKKQTTFLLQTDKIITAKQTTQKKKKIIIFVTNATAHYEVGNFLIASNIILHQPPNSNYKDYLLKDGVWATAHCRESQLKADPRAVIFSQTYLLNLDKQLSKSCSSLFDTIFLGIKDRSIEGLKLQHQSVYWGAAHHIARSGLHLMVLFMLLVTLLHYMQINYFFRYILCGALLLLYSLLSASSVSFTRALIMILLHIFCKLSKKPASSMHIFMLTLCVIALFNPIQIFFLDFQLSFGITFIIIWLFKVKKS